MIRVVGPLPTGTKVEDLIGYRIWRVETGYLKSYSADRVWLPDEPMTGVPDDHGGAGVWAFKAREPAVKKLIETAHITGLWTTWALGTVRLWGAVVEHADGYRAENARVLSLDDLLGADGRTDWPALTAQRERYGLPGVEEARAKAAAPVPIARRILPDATKLRRIMYAMLVCGAVNLMGAAVSLLRVFNAP